jgi:hypothetical protein
MKVLCASILAVLTAVTLMGSISAATVQQVLAIQDSEEKVFRKLTHEFEKAVRDVIGDPNITPEPHLRELLDAYAQDVTRIFLGGPDTIPELLGDYQQEALNLWPFCGPEKHSGIVCMQDFTRLTHDFEKAVINAVTDPED